jgi:DnaK suppressor protein
MSTKKAVKKVKTPKSKAAPKRSSAPAPKRPAAPVPAAPPPRAAPPVRVAGKVRFNDKDLATFRRDLMSLRDRLSGKVVQMRKESLCRDDEVNPEEDGTDAFDRLFALERAGSDQEMIYTIDEALRAIDGGSYGVCETCGGLIEKPRLHALPFAKNCITCQSEMERGRAGATGHRRALP